MEAVPNPEAFAAHVATNEPVPSDFAQGDRFLGWLVPRPPAHTLPGRRKQGNGVVMCPGSPGRAWIEAFDGRSSPVTTSSAAVPSRAVNALRQSSIPSLRGLCVEETDQVVVIGGQVSSYYLKQLDQETIMPVLGGRELPNRVNVVRQQNSND